MTLVALSATSKQKDGPVHAVSPMETTKVFVPPTFRQAEAPVQELDPIVVEDVERRPIPRQALFPIQASLSMTTEEDPNTIAQAPSESPSF